jgi:hypothetical protein
MLADFLVKVFRTFHLLFTFFPAGFRPFLALDRQMVWSKAPRRECLETQGATCMNRPLRRRATVHALEALEVRCLLATLTALPTITGQTPATLGYNLGHFMEGSNAADWWRYEGVRAARAFVSASDIEPTDDIAGIGDGVVDLVSFMNRRSSLRANAANAAQTLDNAFINWPAFRDRYQNSTGNTNRFTINSAFTQLRAQQTEILVNLTASPSRFPLAGNSDWANKWELWQHYYAQAFYLSSTFNVQRYSMFNEPNNWTGLTVDDWLIRLNVCSDAIQSAITDVNSRYAKSLSVDVFAPNTANGATKYLEWGRPAVQQRNMRVDGTTDPNWQTFDVYNYQKYSMNQHETATASGYIEDLQSLRASIAADIPAGPLPIALTEYNVRTGDSYDSRTETLDSPTDYSALGANSVALTEAGASQLYLFKFAQTERTGTTVYPVAKNGTHYVQNGTGSNNYGGATKAAEVYRLFNKAAGSSRDRYAFTSDAGANVWNLLTYDPAGETYYIYVVNNNPAAVPLGINVQAWGIADGTQAVIEEVSQSFSGGVSRQVKVTGGSIPAASMPAYSTWLVSIPRQAVSEISIRTTADTVLGDGVQKNSSGGSLPVLQVRDGGLVDGRQVTLMKFPLTGVDLNRMQRVLLSLQVSTNTQTTPIQAHVYGVTSDAWTESSTWSSSTSMLKQNVPAGNQIAQNVVANQGSGVFMLGQLVAESPVMTERQIDVTEFVRGQSDGWASFLIVQDHRWDIALPSGTLGDTQADGLKIAARESDTAASPGPQLRVLGSQSAMLPLITAQPASTTVTEGAPATFQVAVTGSSSLAFQWLRNGTPIAGATGAVYSVSRTAGTDNLAKYSVRVTNPAGVTTSAEAVLTVQMIPAKFFVVDQTSDSTFRYQPSGSFIGANALQTANINPRGVATDASAALFWVLDANKSVYVYNSALQFVGSWTASGLTTPTGISKQGNDIWIVDSSLKRVLVYAGAALTHTGTKTATRTFNLNKSNTNPQDLVTDGTTVWVTQVDTIDRIFVYRASNGQFLGSWNIDSANGSPVGITIDPSVASGSLWTVDSVTKRVYEYSNARSRTTGSQAAARFFDLNSANSSPQGLADPPVPAPSEPSGAPADARSSATAENAFGTAATGSARIPGQHASLFNATDRLFTDWTRSQTSPTMIVADVAKEREPESEPRIEKKKSNGRWSLPVRSFTETFKRSLRRRARSG